MEIDRNFEICEFVSEFAATVLPSCPGQFITPRMNISFKMSRNKLNIISFRNWPSVLPWGAPKSSERVSLFALFIIMNCLRLLRKLLVSLLCYEFGHRDHIYIVFFESRSRSILSNVPATSIKMYAQTNLCVYQAKSEFVSTRHVTAAFGTEIDIRWLS